jgi:hypothetical protein
MKVVKTVMGGLINPKLDLLDYSEILSDQIKLLKIKGIIVKQGVV